MKKVIMTREKIFRASEYEIDPNDPQVVLNSEEFVGFDEPNGVWNEYYRVGVVDTDDPMNEVADFTDNAQDFYSFKEAQERYSELAKEVKMENIEAEIRSYEDAGLTPPKELLKERYM